MPEKRDKANLLVNAAKVVGKTAGKVAALAGAEVDKEPMRTQPRAEKQNADGKLPKKHKSRLPRRQKKALQKARLKA